VPTIGLFSLPIFLDFDFKKEAIISSGGDAAPIDKYIII
jgi:hypothetical protein